MTVEHGGAVRRKAMRLAGYDYSRPGAYFVTICTFERACLLGEVVRNTCCLSATGRLVETVWSGIPILHPGFGIDEFSVMPNHVHGIIIVPNPARVPCMAPVRDGIVPSGAMNRAPTDHTALGGGAVHDARAGWHRAPAGHTGPRPEHAGAGRGPVHGVPALGEIVRAFKARTTIAVNRSRATFGSPVWQRNYHEHVIRDDRDMDRVRRYIEENPARWAFDRENPESLA